MYYTAHPLQGRLSRKPQPVSPDGLWPACLASDPALWAAALTAGCPLLHTPRRAQKGSGKLGYEAEAFAIYDTMRFIKPEVCTVCVGTAWGESAMLLAAGAAVSGARGRGRRGWGGVQRRTGWGLRGWAGCSCGPGCMQRHISVGGLSNGHCGTGGRLGTTCILSHGGILAFGAAAAAQPCCRQSTVEMS